MALISFSGKEQTLTFSLPHSAYEVVFDGQNSQNGRVYRAENGVFRVTLAPFGCLYLSTVKSGTVLL